MLGIRCQGNDAGHAHCRNPRCACPGHDNDPDWASKLREAKNHGSTHRKYRSVYYMDNPEEGVTYDFYPQ